MTPPRISVAIPTFNRATYLRRAITCLLSQEFQDFEIVVSDNASTDDTPVVVSSFDDPRIRYFRNETNVGVIENYWLGGSRARGEWIVLHQDDDLLHPTFLSRCSRAIDRHPEVAMYVAGLQYGYDIDRLFSGRSRPSRSGA